jgi:sarcosine oxidase
VHYDVAVVGLGATGSAALYHMAKRGRKVLGLDQFNSPHGKGSSHGETRVIREAYFESPIYVPLVQRAYRLWDELQRESAQRLFLQTGGIMLGDPGSTMLRGTLQSAHEHNLPYEILTAENIRTRFPGLKPRASMKGVVEPRAGILFPEKCILAHLGGAAQAGAEILQDEAVLSWESNSTGVTLRTARSQYQANHLILAAGSWLPSLLDFHLPLAVERQVVLWFKPLNPELFAPDLLPIHLWEYEKEKFFYGIPDLGEGLKVAFHHGGELTSPDRVIRQV